MRLKFKYIVIFGLVLAMAQAWLKPAKSKSDAPAAVDSNSDLSPMPVLAREPVATPFTITPQPVTNWQMQVGGVLTSQVSTTNKAINLLSLFPNLPEEGQLQVAQHTSRLLPDNYYSSLGAQMTNAAIAPAARRAIFADLLTRPNSVKLPWLVAVAGASLDGQSDEAALVLSSILNEDHGTNWPLWRERVTIWLSLHPDPTPPPIPGTNVRN